MEVSCWLYSIITQRLCEVFLRNKISKGWRTGLKSSHRPSDLSRVGKSEKYCALYFGLLADIEWWGDESGIGFVGPVWKKKVDFSNIGTGPAPMVAAEPLRGVPEGAALGVVHTLLDMVNYAIQPLNITQYHSITLLTPASNLPS